ncbi:hypothetical protein HaLaN_25331 [Haematococcus lacustris]|uniref:Uncharacterized protein n=1 Tax=Haematococcus lacustris TaxID=44745 RepID=A0A699ZXA7_HAELA|nr:hypothetical protein HaLaN_25331 [Haematococcus lacustris]
MANIRNTLAGLHGDEQEACACAGAGASPGLPTPPSAAASGAAPSTMGAAPAAMGAAPAAMGAAPAAMGAAPAAMAPASSGAAPASSGAAPAAQGAVQRQQKQQEQRHQLQQSWQLHVPAATRTPLGHWRWGWQGSTVRGEGTMRGCQGRRSQPWHECQMHIDAKCHKGPLAAAVAVVAKCCSQVLQLAMQT